MCLLGDVVFDVGWDFECEGCGAGCLFGGSSSHVGEFTDFFLLSGLSTVVGVCSVWFNVVISYKTKEIAMTFEAGKHPVTGVRAKRSVIYDFLRANPGRSFSVPELRDALGIQNSTLWSSLTQMTTVAEVVASYPHVHGLQPPKGSAIGSRFVFDPSLQRSRKVLSRKELAARRSKKAARSVVRRSVPVVKGTVAQVSESVFGLKPVRDARLMQDAAGKRYVVSQVKGRTEIVEI